MKRFPFILFLLSVASLFAQPADQVEYYKGIDFTLTGTALKAELANRVTSTHTKKLSYKQIWDATKTTDLLPSNSNEVVLIYGWKNGSGQHAYSRSVNNNGGNNGQWNREHVYAKSLGSPNLGETGPGSDAHHLRSSDVQWNAARGNQKFASGNGNSGNVTDGWYPGDEWKGDVARMMMYMYLRYGTQCLPSKVGIGSTEQTPDGMIDLFLKWNADDPVSEIEINRNQYHGNTSNTYAQGNRNPFIDNPRLATTIWGGPEAQDRWNNLSVNKKNQIEFSVYPNPTYNQKIYIQTTSRLDQVIIYSMNGKQVKKVSKPEKTNNGYNINYLPQGVYQLQIKAEDKSGTQKIIVL
ncbi:endonuclease [Myroides guanonis]|uniref:Por secretion system C-terminal sorting domain-containing protein n=1 Tax=Myroides guanonis TaxID=1150112 RepID=A0A1I3PJ18_9FLAO|nr:endonuclease [Myroides guanonis]SFJ21350.1 Por secretion system C-terminal sorting domain-containing protein [Myroides guanonis]